MNASDETKFIIENYKKFTYDEMAKKMGIKKSCYESKLRRLRDKGLVEKKKPRKKTIAVISHIDRTDEQLKEGKQYNIRYTGRYKKDGTDRFTGTLLKKADRFYVFRSNSGYIECFLKIDFATREYAIKEVENESRI